MKPDLTQARLKELLHYDPETGHFTWLAARNNFVPKGARAGCQHPSGYRYIKLFHKSRSEHRLAFLYMVGVFPPKEVDHINRVKSDNRWSNLRPATRVDNMSNLGVAKNNTSGHRGVYWYSRDGRWAVRFRKRHVGYYDTFEEAVIAVEKQWADNPRFQP